MQLKFLPSVLMERENRFPFLIGSKKREKNKAIRENENLSAAQVLKMERFMCGNGRRGERRWLHLCCVNEGERDRKKVRGRKCQRVFVSFITQQQYCFWGHLKLTACLISSGDSLQFVCEHVCMLCECAYVCL